MTLLDIVQIATLQAAWSAEEGTVSLRMTRTAPFFASAFRGRCSKVARTAPPCDRAATMPFLRTHPSPSLDLAAVALPAYTDYTVRSRVSEVILAASSCRTSVSEALTNAPGKDATGVLATACSFVPTKFVQGGALDTGTATITVYGNPATLLGDTTATANKVSLKPYKDAANPVGISGATDGGVTISEWRCGPALVDPMPAKYLTGSCKGI
ncbi:MAG: hypothetical protein EON54_16920 [Alcaligenaceae bacterium]|nr:MAG: hypothetical protein EON54_16920 [Alcaligenaceae bacterium]